MVDLSNYDPNSVSNPNNNIFGLPTTEETARLVVLAVPWEVTVSYGAGAARAPEAIFKASRVEGTYFPISIEFMVCRETLTFSARSA